MLPPAVANIPALINAIGDHLRGIHKPFGGAHFRVVFARDNGLRFLTGCVLFQERHIAARGEHDYGSLVFVEEWVSDQWEANARLSGLLSGNEKICGHEIKHIFQQSFASRDFSSGIDGNPTWRIMTHIQRDSNWKDLYLAQNPVLAYGKRPYASPAHAANDWLFGVDNPADTNANVPNQWTLVTLIPDLRAKITSAEWLPGRLEVELDLRVPSDQLQLQIICVGSNRVHQVYALGHGIQQIDVPDDARRLSVFLVDRTNDCVAQLHLSSLYETYGKAKHATEGLTQARADLASGENDRVEFKPFIQIGESKEFEVVKTVIAFANTYGGTIFVGVDDDGMLQGEAAACRALKGSIQESIAAQISRLKQLIRENVKPVPTFQVRHLTVDGHPLVALKVARGNSPLYATHQNQIFVRRGPRRRRVPQVLTWPNECAEEGQHLWIGTESNNSVKRFCWLHWYLGTLLAICLLATVAAFTLVGLIYEWCSRAPERKYAGSGKGALMPKVRDRAAAGTPVIVNWGAAEPSLHVASAATFSRGNSAMRSR